MSAGPSYAAPLEANKRVLPENFPVGMKVLLVDDDLICLEIIERMLLKCLYDVTACSEASKALSLLLDENNTFDLVVTNVYMPGMDGFELLEIVGLETDLPVVMLSADTRLCLAKSGIMHGACDFLTKPLAIWKHVKANLQNDKEIEKQGGMEEPSCNAPDTVAAEAFHMVNDGNDMLMNPQGRKRGGLDDDSDEFYNIDPLSSKKPRVVWSPELHQLFVRAVNFLGIDGAVPSRILELMNVPKLTRGHIGSHLQKYRLSLNKLNKVCHDRTETASPSSAGPVREMSQLAKKAPHSLPVFSQIPLQVPAPFCNASKTSGMNNQVVLQAHSQGVSPVAVDQGVAFGQGLGMSPLIQGWSSNYPGLVESASNIRRPITSQNGSMLNVMLQQQPQPRFPEQILNGQSSSLGASSPSTENFHFQHGPLLSNQDSIIGRSKSASDTQADKEFFPKNLNSSDLYMMSSTNMCIGSSGILINESSNIPPQPLGKISIASNRDMLTSTSVDFPIQQSTSFQPLYPHLLNPDSVVVPCQSSTIFPSGNNFSFSPRNSSLSSSNSITELSRLLSPLDIGYSSTHRVDNEIFNNQALNGYFNSVAMVTNLAVPESVPSSLSPCTHGNSVWQVQNPTEDNGGRWNGFTSGVSGPNIQVSSRISGEISNVRQASTNGFVGNSSYIPARFGLDDMESLRNVSTGSDMC